MVPVGSVRHAVAYCNLFNALIRSTCMCTYVCVGFASKITDGIVTGSSWTIYGVFLFMNGDLFGTTPTILNGIYVILLNFRTCYTYIFGSLLSKTII